MASRRSAAKLYRWLLLAYPSEFRHEYGAQMQQLLDERLASEPPLQVWLAAVKDTLITAPREHIGILTRDLRHALRIALTLRS